MESISVRAAVLSDLPRLTEIYNHYVEHTPVTFDLKPFTVDGRRDWFSQFALTGRYRLLVADEQGRVLGYAGTTRFRQKPAYDPTVETTIYCAPEAMGRSVGRLLYGSLFEALGGEDIHRIVGGFTLPNPASAALHAHFGFKAVGIFTEVGRKFGRYWDVCWTERPLRVGLSATAPGALSPSR